MSETSMTLLTITDDQRRDSERGSGRMIGNVCAALSLLCCLSFLTLIAVCFITRVDPVKLTGFQWLKIMGLAVVLALVSAVLQSKLWRIAVPVSLAIFFLTMYVMGS